MVERIEQIRQAGGDHAAEVLSSAYKEMLTAKERAASGKSADIKDFQGRNAALEKSVAEFEAMYKTDTFKNLSAVYSYLAEQGYKIANRTIYQHKNEGKLKSGDDGVYLKKNVDEYAEKYLELLDNENGSGSLIDQKNEAEIKLKQLRGQREQILIDEAMGRLISRDKVGREFAARIEEIKRGFEEIENTLPELLEGKNAHEIRETIKWKHDYILEQYSRKLEAVR